MNLPCLSAGSGGGSATATNRPEGPAAGQVAASVSTPNWGTPPASIGVKPPEQSAKLFAALTKGNPDRDSVLKKLARQLVV
jgi:hypothetical protein